MLSNSTYALFSPGTSQLEAKRSLIGRNSIEPKYTVMTETLKNFSKGSLQPFYLRIFVEVFTVLQSNLWIFASCSILLAVSYNRLRFWQTCRVPCTYMAHFYHHCHLVVCQWTNAKSPNSYSVRRRFHPSLSLGNRILSECSCLF